MARQKKKKRKKERKEKKRKLRTTVTVAFEESSISPVRGRGFGKRHNELERILAGLLHVVIRVVQMKKQANDVVMHLTMTRIE
jgi:hypothetical protein